MVAMKKISGCYGMTLIAIEVNDCYGKSMVAMEANGCYGIHWLILCKKHFMILHPFWVEPIYVSVV
jgi:hypothetical protein